MASNRKQLETENSQHRASNVLLPDIDTQARRSEFANRTKVASAYAPRESAFKLEDLAGKPILLEKGTKAKKEIWESSKVIEAKSTIDDQKYSRRSSLVPPSKMPNSRIDPVIGDSNRSSDTEEYDGRRRSSVVPPARASVAKVSPSLDVLNNPVDHSKVGGERRASVAIVSPSLDILKNPVAQSKIGEDNEPEGTRRSSVVPPLRTSVPKTSPSVDNLPNPIDQSKLAESTDNETSSARPSIGRKAKLSAIKNTMGNIEIPVKTEIFSIKEVDTAKLSSTPGEDNSERSSIAPLESVLKNKKGRLQRRASMVLHSKMNYYTNELAEEVDPSIKAHPKSDSDESVDPGLHNRRASMVLHTKMTYYKNDLAVEDKITPKPPPKKDFTGSMKIDTEYRRRMSTSKISYQRNIDGDAVSPKPPPKKDNNDSSENDGNHRRRASMACQSKMPNFKNDLASNIAMSKDSLAQQVTAILLAEQSSNDQSLKAQLMELLNLQVTPDKEEFKKRPGFNTFLHLKEAEGSGFIAPPVKRTSISNLSKEEWAALKLAKAGSTKDMVKPEMVRASSITGAGPVQDKQYVQKDELAYFLDRDYKNDPLWIHLQKMKHTSSDNLHDSGNHFIEGIPVDSNTAAQSEQQSSQNQSVDDQNTANAMVVQPRNWNRIRRESIILLKAVAAYRKHESRLCNIIKETPAKDVSIPFHSLKGEPPAVDKFSIEKVKKYLSIAPEKRSEEVIEQLHRVLYHTVPDFAKFPKDDRLSFCRLMSLETHEAGKVLFKEGQVATCFYFLLTGKIEIFKLSNGLRLLLNYVSPGNILGHRMFDQGGGKRTAYVSTSVPSELLHINKESYLKVFPINIGRNPLFEHHQEFLNSILPGFKVYNFNIHQTIQEQNRQPMELYFILEGNCRVTQLLPFVKNPKTKKLEPTHPDDPNAEMKPIETLQIASGDSFPPIPELGDPATIRYLGDQAIERDIYIEFYSKLRITDPRTFCRVSVECAVDVTVAAIPFGDFLKNIPKEVLYSLITEPPVRVFPIEKIQEELMAQTKWKDYRKAVMAEYRE